MTVAPIPGHAPDSTVQGHPHSRLARRAVGLAAVFGVAFATWWVGFVIGGEAFYDRSDWGTGFAVITMLVGLVAAVAASVMAIVSLVKGERWTLLLVPLCAFPALLVFLIVGEAFWWE